MDIMLEQTGVKAKLEKDRRKRRNIRRKQQKKREKKGVGGKVDDKANRHAGSQTNI